MLDGVMEGLGKDHFTVEEKGKTFWPVGAGEARGFRRVCLWFCGLRQRGGRSTLAHAKVLLTRGVIRSGFWRGMRNTIQGMSKSRVVRRRRGDLFSR